MLRINYKGYEIEIVVSYSYHRSSGRMVVFQGYPSVRVSISMIRREMMIRSAALLHEQGQGGSSDTDLCAQDVSATAWPNKCNFSSIFCTACCPRRTILRATLGILADSCCCVVVVLNLQQYSGPASTQYLHTIRADPKTERRITWSHNRCTRSPFFAGGAGNMSNCTHAKRGRRPPTPSSTYTVPCIYERKRA